jgi:hypothetical protein
MSRSAATICVSQPAVSIQIAELEDALGVRLLDRYSERQPSTSEKRPRHRLTLIYTGMSIWQVQIRFELIALTIKL